MKYIFLFFIVLFVSCKQNLQNLKDIRLENNPRVKAFETLYHRFNTDTLTDINKNFDFNIIDDLNDENDTNIVRFMYFSNNLSEDWDTFIKKAFTSCHFLDSIGVKKDTITLFLNQKKLYQEQNIGDSVYWVYHYYFYHDIYYAFFNFERFNAIQVFSVDENKSIENETFLPNTGDIHLLIEDKTMCRKWYKKTPKEWEKTFKKDIIYLGDTLSFNPHSFKITNSILDSLFLEKK